MLIEPGPTRRSVLVTRAHSGIYIRGMDRNTCDPGRPAQTETGRQQRDPVEQAKQRVDRNLTVEISTAPRKGDGDRRRRQRDLVAGQKQGETDEQSGQNKAPRLVGQLPDRLRRWVPTAATGSSPSTPRKAPGNTSRLRLQRLGIYIGACWECKRRVSNATIEYNAVGYSGSNAGGRLVIEKSAFRQNSAGIVPGTRKPGGDGPPPQNGICNAQTAAQPATTLFTTTKIEHCFVLKGKTS